MAAPNSGLLLYVLLSPFGVRALKNTSQNEEFISIMVRFDYNSKTFVPVIEPIKGKLVDVNESEAGTIRQAFDQYRRTPFRTTVFDTDFGSFGGCLGDGPPFSNYGRRTRFSF